MKKRIMIVDDSYGYAELLQTTLRSLGYHVSIASGGTACLAVVETERPDLIFLDLLMPGMDGIKSCALAVVAVTI